MKKLSTTERAAILRCLIEGNSILATTRITGAAKNTVVKLLADAGQACAAYQRRHMRNLKCRVLQLDEVWCFVGCREKNKADAINQHPGDVWLWTSICAETKLIPAWRVGDRSSGTAHDFCNDLSRRFAGEIQITSDGHAPYRLAVGSNFDASRTHFAQLVKVYGYDKEGKETVVRADKVPVFGRPDINLISTSYVERSNLTLRMSNRRYTRLTNAFSKKLESHSHMLAISFMHYNFARRHTTIKTAPAVAAGLADHVWTMEEIVEMVDAHVAIRDRQAADHAFALGVLAERKTFPPTPKDQIPLPWYLDMENGQIPDDYNCDNRN